MKAHLLATTALVLGLARSAGAVCTGPSGTPFNCEPASAFTAADLLFGGSNTSPTTNKSVKYTGQQLLDFVVAHYPVPTASLLGGGSGTLVPVVVGAGLSFNLGTISLAPLGTAAVVNIGTAGATLGLLNSGVVLSGNDQFTGGVAIGSPTGGMPGAGTLNAAALLLNNVPVITSTSQQWTAGSVNTVVGGAVAGGTLTVSTPTLISETCVAFDSTTTVTAQTVEFPIPWTSYTISSLKAATNGTGSPSFTVAVKINGTNVTGLSAVTVNSSSNTNTSASGANTGVVNDQISVAISAPSGVPQQAYICPVFSHPGI